MKLPFALRMAKIGASRSKCKVKMGAALVAGGKIVITSNKAKSSPALKRHHYKYQQQIHAELDLFYRPPSTTVAATAVVAIYREKKNGELALARPCAFCMAVLKLHQVRKIIYSTDNGYQTEKLQ